MVLKSLTRVSAAVIVLISVTSIAATASGAQQFTKEHPLKVALVLNGNLGDRSFFDSAAAGIQKAKADLPLDVKVIELGYDRSKWQAGLGDASDSGFDVVIAGTFDMTPYIVKLAPQYPGVKFIDFDDSPDFAKCKCQNVLAVQYGTSTAGYLAGYAAARISKSKVLGTILGMEFPAVTDFKTGFDQGAKDADPKVKILNTVAGTFSDPAKGKEIARALLNQGADIIFPIASGTGLGALQAVKEAGGGRLAVGVDSDQATIFAASDAAQADVIFTSVEKKVGESLYLALKGTVDGAQPYGQRVVLGLKDGAVGISKNAQYKKLVPADVRADVEEKEKAIIDGAIIVAADVK